MATPRRTSRTCRRPGCARSATATLLLFYVEASVRIDALHDEPHPAHWDMCAEHADGLRVPRGWRRTDRRGAAAGPDASADTTAGRESGTEQDPRSSPAATSPVTSPDTPTAVPPDSPPRVNRYAALTACLPQIAAALEAAGQPELGPLPPDIPGQLSLPVADDPASGGCVAADDQESAGDAPDLARPATSTAAHRRTAPAPDNVVPLVRRGVDALDPIG